MQYWHLGTQVRWIPNTHAFSIRNDNPDSLLGVYTLKARKGLPFGFEIAGALGLLANTSLWVGGADVRWALLEGFRTGRARVPPGHRDRRRRAHARRIAEVLPDDGGPRRADLEAHPARRQRGAHAVRRRAARLIFADSSVVNLTPGVDPLNCGYQGPNVPGNPNATPANLGGMQQLNDGMPLCKRLELRLRQRHDLREGAHPALAMASPGSTTGSRCSTWPRSSPWTSPIRAPRTESSAWTEASSGRRRSKQASLSDSRRRRRDRSGVRWQRLRGSQPGSGGHLGATRGRAGVAGRVRRDVPRAGRLPRASVAA